MDLSAAYCRIKVFKKETKDFLYNHNLYNSKPQINNLINNMLTIINYAEINDYHSAIYLLRELNWYLAELQLMYGFFDDDIYNIISIIHKATCKSLDNKFKFEYFNKNKNCIVSYECNNKFESERIHPNFISKIINY